MGMTLNLGVKEVKRFDGSAFVHIDNSILWIEFTEDFLRGKDVMVEDLMRAKIICLTIGDKTTVFSFLGLKSLDEISELKILAV